MKRLTCLLILLTLLLSACNGASSPILPSIPQSSATEPSTTEPIPTEPAPTIGVHVQTDYSAYEPRKFTPKFTRLQSEPIYDLVPSDSYGKLYPFAGKENYVSYEDGFGYSEGFSYGMVTEDGCIVVDPVYSYVSRMELPYWRLTKQEQSTEHEYIGVIRSAIASLDGSVVTKCVYERLYEDGNRILAIYGDQTLRFDLLDENLNVVLSSDQLWQSERLTDYRLEYSEGVLLLAYNTGVQDEYGWEEVEHYFAYETGEIFAGPYPLAYGFSGGMACVQMEDETYTYIDLQGNPMGRSFEHADSFHKSGVAVVDTEGTSELIDRNGKTILSFPRNECYMSIRGDRVIVTDSNTYAESIYDLDGRLIYDAKEHPLWSLISNTYVYFCETYLVDALTDARYELPPDGSAYCQGDKWEDPQFLIVNYGGYEDNSVRYRILSLDLEELATNVKDYQTLDDGIMVNEGNGYTLLNEKGERVWECPLARIETADLYEDGTLSLSDGFASYLYDENFELIFCYPLTNAMED